MAKVKHGNPGIGATKSSAYVPLKQKAIGSFPEEGESYSFTFQSKKSEVNTISSEII